MALTLTELQSITDFYVDSTDNDIYFKSNVLLFKLLAMGKTIPGGKKIQVVLEHAKGNTGSYGATTKLPLSKKEIYNAAFFRWAAYFAGVTVDLEDQRQNSGDLAIVNMVNGNPGDHIDNGQTETEITKIPVDDIVPFAPFHLIC